MSKREMNEKLEALKQGSRLRFYRQLITSMLKISAFTFGGGYVIVPLMRKRFVEDYGWIDETEMMDLVAIAQSSPGSIAVNIAIMVGYRVDGLPGSIISAFVTVLPPIVIISVISHFYDAFISNPFAVALMRGMSIGVVAVIFDVVLSLGLQVFKSRKVTGILLLFAAFAASVIFKVNLALIIFLCGLIGALDLLWHKRHGGKAS